MNILQRLREIPGHILAWLALFLAAGALDLAYHAYGLIAGGEWLIIALGGGEDTAFAVNLSETVLHGVVALGLIAFVIAAFSHRLAEDERRQVERERAGEDHQNT